jgi:hypothetical protein
VRAGPLKPRGDFVAFNDLLVHGPMKIGECSSHGTDDIFDAHQPRALARKGNLLDNVFPKEVPGGLDVSSIEGLLNELANDAGVISHDPPGYSAGEEPSSAFIP